MYSAPRLLLNFYVNMSFRHAKWIFTKLKIQYLQERVYRAIGWMMSTIIVQGDEPPSFVTTYSGLHRVGQHSSSGC